MKVLILLSFLAMAAARPEAGYSYSRPQQQQQQQSHHHSVSHNGYNHNGEFKNFKKKRK
jgi:hypothetical protein